MNQNMQNVQNTGYGNFQNQTGTNNNPNNTNTNNIPFIAGRIGNKDIAKEDLNTFMSSIKDIEWTDNNVYKPAKNVEIKPTFSLNPNDSNVQFQSKLAAFDQFFLEETPHLENFKLYKNDIETRRIQMQDKILLKKKDFVDTYLSDEKVSESAEKKELLEFIKSNKVKIIENSNLKEKLEKFMGFLKIQDMNTGKNHQFDFTLLNK